MKQKNRLIVLTDINLQKWIPFAERDDVQSLLRLLLYSNDIELEGIIACTSCFLKNGAGAKNLAVIHRCIAAYEKAKPNLDCHAEGYPTAEYLRGISCTGIPAFGQAVGDGFCEDRYDDNTGVKMILAAMDKADPRPLWISLWGGANTLAQAVYTARKTHTAEELDRILRKLRIYGISDQDCASGWLRENFGDRLFYIVTPSKGDSDGSKDYYQATWPGMSSDRFGHGSEDGRKGGGFKGADFDLVSNRFIRSRIHKTAYGKIYPTSVFIMEGDTPAYLGLIPNGLNVSERPDLGGWGGRYEFYRPKPGQFPVEETYPIWTNAADTMTGEDGKQYTSPQATIWRWRREVQNDFLGRLAWTESSDESTVSHNPAIHAECKRNGELLALNNGPSTEEPQRICVHPGDQVELDLSGSNDLDGKGLDFSCMNYKEAGKNAPAVEIFRIDTGFKIRVPDFSEKEAGFEVQLVITATGRGVVPMSAYKRICLVGCSVNTY